jgi:hypothetical protein
VIQKSLKRKGKNEKGEKKKRNKNARKRRLGKTLPQLSSKSIVLNRQKRWPGRRPQFHVADHKVWCVSYSSLC